MKSSALLAPGLFCPGLDGRRRPEMFAIIICLRGHRYKHRSAPYILVLFLFHLLLSPTDRILSSLVISLFCLLTFLPRFSTLARASFRSFWPFGERALNCPVVYATVPGKDEENLGTDRDSTRTNGERHENSECTCFEAYASKAGDKQKRGKELVLRIGSQSRNTFARDIDRLCLFFPRNECIFSYILRENKKHAGIQVNSHS